MKEACIEVSHLTKAFQGRRVVDDLSFRVEPGEVFPRGLQLIGGWMPLGVGIRLLKSVSRGSCNEIAVPLLTLIVITLVCGTVAVKTFRWE